MTEEHPFILKINETPKGKWREGSTAETFHSIGFRLLKTGLSEDDVIEILAALYNATANEFGIYSGQPGLPGDCKPLFRVAAVGYLWRSSTPPILRQ